MDVGRREAAAWSRRDDRPQLEQALALQQQLLELAGGGDYALLVKLSRGHYLLGTQTDDTDAKIAAFEAGMRYGDLALYTFEEFRKRVKDEGEAPEVAVAALGPEAVDAIYWDAVNVAKWARAKGMLKVLMMKDKARAMIERVRALQPGYYHGAADRYLGAYHAALPGFAGRDLKKSREHFEASLRLAPGYLPTRVLMAEYLALTEDDAALYRELLEQVLAGDAGALPEVAPELRLAQRQAAMMLDHMDDHFDVDGGEASPQEPTQGAAPAGEAGP
jgi:hypothetical protein